MLKVTPHIPKPLKWWHEQYLRDRLDMAPSYQRKSYIWSGWKQAHLIDSILNDFDIPKFYVANFLEMPSPKLNERKRPYALIDGKQRFQAVFDFFDDRLELNESIVVSDQPSLKLGGFTYSRLKARAPELAEKVELFIPAVMNVVADSDDVIEELFVRLNAGEATTGAERRNAMPGPVPVVVRELVSHPFFQKKVRFNTKRMQDSNLAAKLLLIEYRGGFVDTKARNLDEFVKAAMRQAQDSHSGMPKDLAGARDRVYRTLERMTPVFQDRDRLLSAQGQIPVYYWLARENRNSVKYMRDFLEFFTEAVGSNLRASRDGSRTRSELTNYYTMSRTTNDEASLTGRYKILSQGFSKFIEQQ